MGSEKPLAPQAGSCGPSLWVTFCFGLVFCCITRDALEFGFIYPAGFLGAFFYVPSAED